MSQNATDSPLERFPATEQQQGELRDLNYVRVTGLPVMVFAKTLHVGQDLGPEVFGTHTECAPKHVIITAGGDVWLAEFPPEELATRKGRLIALFDHLCMRGESRWDTLASYSRIQPFHFRQRAIDSTWMPSHK